MKYPKNRYMFTVKDVSRACGVSRATLLRMEESGFLKPYHIDPESGYRYYDVDNITQIGQYKLLLDLGLSRKEAVDLYYQHSNAKEILEKQKQKINKLQRLLNDFEARYEHTKEISFSYETVPEMTCVCKPFDMSSSVADSETLAYSFGQEVIKDGFKALVTEPLFLVLPKRPNGLPLLCFPVETTKKDDPRVKDFPSCHVFSATIHGNYSVLPKLTQKFNEEFKARHLKPAGLPSVITVVGPYAGQHYKPSDYCFKYVVPIKY